MHAPGTTKCQTFFERYTLLQFLSPSPHSPPATPSHPPSPGGPCPYHRPGPTLADCTGAKRLRKLEDSILNLQCQVLEKLEQIDTMAQEAERIREGA